MKFIVFESNENRSPIWTKPLGLVDAIDEKDAINIMRKDLGTNWFTVKEYDKIEIENEISDLEIKIKSLKGLLW